MKVLDRLFHLTDHGTTVRQELLGALTSFFSVAYILFVTPSYLSLTGMDYTGVLLATCLSSALACFLAAAFNPPFMLSPGVSLNVFFTYTLCLPHHGLYLGPGAGGGEPVRRRLSGHQPDAPAGPDGLLYPVQHEKRHQRRSWPVHRPDRAFEFRHRPGPGRRAAAGRHRRPGGGLHRRGGRGQDRALYTAATGVLFLAAILLAPIAGIIPGAATSPALVLIGMLMIHNATNIYWHQAEIALPCFLTMIMIPFTYSVADGIGVGFISYTAISLVSGKGKKIPRSPTC